MMRSTISENTTTTVDAARIVVSNSCSNAKNTSTGNVDVPGFDKKIAIGTSPNEIINAYRLPAKTPGAINGRVIFRKVVILLAPKVSAASSRVG